MSGFVSSPPSTVAPDPEPMLEHGGFFPGVRLSELRDALRVPSQVTDARLIDAACSAMLTVGLDLGAWATARQAEGRETLADVAPDDTIVGEPRLVRLYRRAVHSFTAAELADTHSDISATVDGQKRIDERAPTADEHRRNGLHALRDILGVTRTAVELI